ncbi:hypothetical protein T4A_6690 [Trichinella pseudospiralis]|uniref:G-protein coupled receptors family 1 profile domain-containing protein n=1 Tax=Trichinella pseudospiralis TaxID=6337 RepID=A0A0V0XQP8_TRIPS|nr:hypothetical protein T4E_6736 [Trichinella pseudospiralis]KRY66739.1 hypothetical protein T4A_6690 [Trichinella pseudospiralis]
MNTSNSSASMYDRDYVVAVSQLTVSVGCITVINSALVIVLISMLSSGSKEMVFFRALCISTLVLGVAYTASGTHHFNILNVGDYEVTPLICLIETTFICLYEVGETSGALILLLISLDRLIAMTSMSLYQKFTLTVTAAVMQVTYACGLAGFLGVLAYTALSERRFRKISSLCFHADTVSETYYNVHAYFLLTAHWLSLILYIAALIVMHKHGNISSNSVRMHRLLREKKITQRISMIIFSSVITQIVPMTALASSADKLYDDLGMYFWIIHPLTVPIEIILCCIMRSDAKKLLKSRWNYLRGRVQTITMNERSQKERTITS